MVMEGDFSNFSKFESSQVEWLTGCFWPKAAGHFLDLSDV
jgi:hypothetical protein